MAMAGAAAMVVAAVLCRGPAGDNHEHPAVLQANTPMMQFSQDGEARRLHYTEGALAYPAPAHGQDADALLLRRAFTVQKLDNADFETLLERLRSAFDKAETARTTALHLREQALFAILIEDNPEAALEHARENWTLHQGWDEATLLIHAARAAGRPEAATAVHDWRQRFQTGEF